MSVSKTDFIKNLLKDKTLSVKQREKIYDLIARDFVITEPELNKVWQELDIIKEEINLFKRVDDIEQRLTNLKKEKTKASKPKSVRPIIPEPNPKHVADFMSLFNERKGLKYLTHDFDENGIFNIDEFLKAANIVFEEKTKKLNIPQSLWRIVKQFAFDSKQTEWSSISEDYKKTLPLTIGWATKELRAWSKTNKLHPIHKEEYKEIIDDFKRITRIGEGDLDKLMETTLEKVFANEIESYEVVEKELSKADFYSHVGFLKTAFETIFEEIKKYATSEDKRKISLEYSRGISPENYYLRTVRITHHNSFPVKELAILLQEWHEKGNMGKIKEKLRGYCHWSIETIIGNEPTRVNILKDNDVKTHENMDAKPEGFTHVLTFYYK